MRERESRKNNLTNQRQRERVIYKDDEHKDHHGDFFVVDGCEQAQTVEKEDCESGSQIESSILVAS